MLVINRYTCPITKRVSIQAHVIGDNGDIKSYGKMSIDDIGIFKSHDKIIICDVVRAKNLADINVIKGAEL